MKWQRIYALFHMRISKPPSFDFGMVSWKRVWAFTAEDIAGLVENDNEMMMGLDIRRSGTSTQAVTMLPLLGNGQVIPLDLELDIRCKSHTGVASSGVLKLLRHEKPSSQPLLVLPPCSHQLIHHGDSSSTCQMFHISPSHTGYANVQTTQLIPCIIL